MGAACWGAFSLCHAGAEICPPINSFIFCILFNSLCNFIFSNFFRSLNRSCCLLNIPSGLGLFFFPFKVIMLAFCYFFFPQSLLKTDSFISTVSQQKILDVSSPKMRSGTRHFIWENRTCCVQKTQKMFGNRYSKYMGVNKVMMVLL